MATEPPPVAPTPTSISARASASSLSRVLTFSTSSRMSRKRMSALAASGNHTYMM